MVHALGQVHKLLHREGLLINVNDLPVPHEIEVQTPENIYKVGWLQDRDDFGETLAAFNALAQVVAEGVFLLKDEVDFDYNIYIDELLELQQWLAEWWSSALIPDTIIHRLEEQMREVSQPARIVLKLRVRMTKLVAV